MKEDTANTNATLFKPDDVFVELEGVKYRLIYDLNAMCQLEKIYKSIDELLEMMLGTTLAPDLSKVTYNGAAVVADEILVDKVPLSAYIAKFFTDTKATQRETLNLLWAGCLHDHAVYGDPAKGEDPDEIVRYTVSKAKLGSMVTFQNLQEVNAKIIQVLLRDLMHEALKNAEAPEEAVQSEETEQA